MVRKLLLVVYLRVKRHVPEISLTMSLNLQIPKAFGMIHAIY